MVPGAVRVGSKPRHRCVQPFSYGAVGVVVERHHRGTGPRHRACRARLSRRDAVRPSASLSAGPRQRAQSPGPSALSVCDAAGGVLRGRDQHAELDDVSWPKLSAARLMSVASKDARSCGRRLVRPWTASHNRSRRETHRQRGRQSTRRVHSVGRTERSVVSSDGPRQKKLAGPPGYERIMWFLRPTSVVLSINASPQSVEATSIPFLVLGPEIEGLLLAASSRSGSSDSAPMHRCLPTPPARDWRLRVHSRRRPEVRHSRLPRRSPGWDAAGSEHFVRGA